MQGFSSMSQFNESIQWISSLSQTNESDQWPNPLSQLYEAMQWFNAVHPLIPWSPASLCLVIVRRFVMFLKANRAWIVSGALGPFSSFASLMFSVCARGDPIPTTTGSNETSPALFRVILQRCAFCVLGSEPTWRIFCSMVFYPNNLLYQLNFWSIKVLIDKHCVRTHIFAQWTCSSIKNVIDGKWVRSKWVFCDSVATWYHV